MRRIFLVVFIIASAMYFFLVAAVNDDIKWFSNFSKEGNKKVAKSFQSIDFTYDDVFLTCFSIKFTQSDTAYIRQHFASPFSDNLQSETSYFTLLSKEERITLDSFINIIPFHSYDTSYHENYQDGIDFQFYIQKNTINKSIRVHSNSVPSALLDFKNWIIKRKEQYYLHQVDTIIHFESAKNVVPPPPPPPPSIEIKVPTAENSR